MNRSSHRNVLVAVVRSLSPCRRRREEEGASLVEFAIILPVFALMLFGMIQFGLAFVGWDQLRNAVQTGARLAANTTAASPTPNCGQTDIGDNLVCQISFLIGTPVDTSPVPLTSPIPIPSSDECSPLLDSCNSYAWLDGYYIYLNGQWLQIVNSNASSGEFPDQQAFEDGRQPWSCTAQSPSSPPYCTAMATNVTGQNLAAIGSDNISMTVQNSQLLEICAQRDVISFTALPGIQGLHVSTTSSFFLPATSPLTATSTTTYPISSSCG